MRKEKDTTEEEQTKATLDKYKYTIGEIKFKIDVLRKRSLPPEKRAKELGAVKLLFYSFYLRAMEKETWFDTMLDEITEYYKVNPQMVNPPIEMVKKYFDKTQSDRVVFKNKMDFSGSGARMLAINFKQLENVGNNKQIVEYIISQKNKKDFWEFMRAIDLETLKKAENIMQIYQSKLST